MHGANTFYGISPRSYGFSVAQSVRLLPCSTLPWVKGTQCTRVRCLWKAATTLACLECNANHHTLLYEASNLHTVSTTVATALIDSAPVSTAPQLDQGNGIHASPACSSTPVRPTLVAKALVRIRDSKSDLHTTREFLLVLLENPQYKPHKDWPFWKSR